MKPLGNQPFDFGYSDTCECGENDYEQFFFTSDTIQVAFEIEPCEGNESFLPVFLAAQPGWEIEGSIACVTRPVLSYISWTWGLPSGYYKFTVNIQSITSGNVTFIRQTGGIDIFIDTFSNLGNNEIYAFIPSGTTFILLRSNIGGENDFVGCVSLDIETIEYPTNQELYLVDTGGNEITNFDKFYRDNYVIFGGVPFSGLTLTDCLYRLRWIDECDEYPSFQYSNFFKIVDGDGDECTIALSGCFPGYQLGFPEDFEPLVRLSGRIARPQYTGEILTSRDSEGYSRVNYLDREKTMQLLINLVPEYILDFISVWIGFEQMYINGQSYRIADDSFPEIQYPESTDLGQLEFTVKRVRQNIKRINCFALESPCEEVPPPPNLGEPKQFMDDDLFEFQDGEQYTFQ
jgi:hypothetical protein